MSVAKLGAVQMRPVHSHIGGDPAGILAQLWPTPPQTHIPLRQPELCANPGSQALPQVPQLLGSVSVL